MPLLPGAILIAVAYLNGHWWDGERFVDKTVGAGEAVDLKAGYVVPAFGEAHNHNVESLNDLPKLVAKYVEHGIFYVKNPNNLPRDRPSVPPLEVSYANGGWTSAGGHPIEIAKRVIGTGKWTERDGEGAFYWTAETPADVAAKWPAYIAQKPDFVKVYLLYAGSARDPAKHFGWKGLAPETVREIVKRAHAAHLRVSAHIESARDFHEALVAGVDEINHMPGFRMRADVEPHAESELELSDADAELAHRNGVVVVTTLCGALRLSGQERAEQDALNLRNLRRLVAHQVKIAIGSDSYRQDALDEALYLASLHAVSNAQLLRMWTTTVETIFPGRVPSRFLVLAGNPLDDFGNVAKIVRTLP